MTNDTAPRATPRPLRILHQDEHLVAVHKPIGMFVHRSRESGRDEQFLLQLTRDQIGQKLFPVHRLDRPTSGIVLFALDAQTAGCVSEQFRNRTVTKHYEAVVRGFSPDRMVLDRPLGRKPHRDTSDTGGRMTALPCTTVAITKDRWDIPIASDRYRSTRCSRLEIHPRTGRRHQIRRHLKHASYPILGDRTHGDHRLNHLLAESIGLHRMMLIAMILEVEHPVTKAPLRIETSPEDDYAEFLRTIASMSTRQ